MLILKTVLLYGHRLCNDLRLADEGHRHRDAAEGDRCDLTLFLCCFCAVFTLFLCLFFVPFHAVSCRFMLKMMDWIGGLLGKKVGVRSAVDVNSTAMKAIKIILTGKGCITRGKVLILVGGPDWPTSVRF